MKNPVRFEITVKANIRTEEYGNKEQAFSALGRFLDQFANQYGGVVSNLECTNKEYKDNETTKVMLKSVRATMHCNGIVDVDNE